MGGTAVLIVALGIGGAVSGGDAAAVAAVVEQSHVTSAKIEASSGTLTTTIDEAKTLADQIRGEVDPADAATLQQAITAAETVAAGSAEPAATDMSLDEAKAAHTAAAALLARLDAADAPLRSAIDAANAAHGTFVAAALTQAKTDRDGAQAALAATLANAEQVFAGSESRVADDAVRGQLRAAIDAARDASASVPAEDHKAYQASVAAIEAANRGVDEASQAVNAAVGAKTESDRVAAEQAAAAKAAADQAAAEKAAADKAAAAKAAADKAAAQKAAGATSPGGSGSSGVGKTSYKNCADVWATIGRPIYPSDPGYTSGPRKLDGNSDGVGCESRP